MNKDYMANMLFNINDVVETIQGHSINNDIIEEYDESQFEEEPITLMDIPKDWEGSSISIGDCLLDLQTHINELYNYFSSQEEVQPLKCNPIESNQSIMTTVKETDRTFVKAYVQDYADAITKTDRDWETIV